MLVSREPDLREEGLVLALRELDSGEVNYRKPAGPSSAILRSEVWAFGRSGKSSTQETDTSVIKCKGPRVLNKNFCNVLPSEASKDFYKCTMSDIPP